MYVIKTSYNGEQIYHVCPSCNKEFICYPAISRKDNKTKICPECGMIEAVINFFDNHKKKKATD